MIRRIGTVRQVQIDRAAILAEIMMLNAEIEEEQRIESEMQSFREWSKDWLAFAGLFLFLALVLWPLGVR